MIKVAGVSSEPVSKASWNWFNNMDSFIYNTIEKWTNSKGKMQLRNSRENKVTLLSGELKKTVIYCIKYVGYRVVWASYE